MAAFDEDNNGQNLWYATKWLEDSEGLDGGGPPKGPGCNPFLVGVLIAAVLFIPGAIVAWVFNVI